MIAVLAAALISLQTPTFNFTPYGGYSSKSPTPESILGYLPGERHTTFREQENYLFRLAESAPSRMKMLDYGKSTEGRPLRVMIFSNPENMKRLEEIRKRNLSLSTAAGDPQAVSKDNPAIVWINQCIHGDESASFESVMWLAYNLAASRSLEEMLKDVVVIVNPVYNPDGHERFVVWSNSVAVGSADERAPEHNQIGGMNGRVNHYRFDMNRDRVSLSQLESRQEVAEFLRWTPQVYVDQHGEVGTYFMPPVAMSVNRNVDRARYERWSDTFGRATATAFDNQGWRYYIRETFDLYYPGYLDLWATLSGSIGMTHETDAGGSIRIQREDGSIATLSGGMAKHFVSAMSVIRATAQNRQGLIQSFGEFKRGAVSGEHAGEFRRVVVEGEARALRRLGEQLAAHGIEYGFAKKEFHQSAVEYSGAGGRETEFSAGALVVDMNQAQGPLAKALLEPGSDFEKEFVERQLRIRKEQLEKEQYPQRDRPEFYDTTGWSIPLAHGLRAWWSSDQPRIELDRSSDRTPIRQSLGKTGWAIPYRDQDDALAVIELLQAGVRVHQAGRELSIQGRKFAPGTFFVYRDRNEGDFEKSARAILDRRGCEVLALDSSYSGAEIQGPGSDSVTPIARPKIGIYFGGPDSYPAYGSVWHTFERVFGLSFVPLQSLDDLDDLSCVIIPGGRAPQADAIKGWVQRGGTAVLLGGSGGGLVTLTSNRSAESKAPASLPGALFSAAFNPRSSLRYGYEGSTLPVPVEGGQYFRAKESGGGILSLGESPALLSGWVWPEETDKALSNTIWAHDEPLGSGHIIWFASDPTERAMYPGLHKLLLNAILLGRSPARV